jgi:hypothetical protein
MFNLPNEDHFPTSCRFLGNALPVIAANRPDLVGPCLESVTDHATQLLKSAIFAEDLLGAFLPLFGGGFNAVPVNIRSFILNALSHFVLDCPQPGDPDDFPIICISFICRLILSLDSSADHITVLDQIFASVRLLDGTEVCNLVVLELALMRILRGNQLYVPVTDLLALIQHYAISNYHRTLAIIALEGAVARSPNVAEFHQRLFYPPDSEEDITVFRSIAGSRRYDTLPGPWDRDAIVGFVPASLDAD